ncbi:MAG: hypothetical protein M1818_000373 [Claussenomyces sp. TS43310]|nr:MAG: hypothetical protein M1818_000373 [Claussenomyces sp. TS43310]
MPPTTEKPLFDLKLPHLTERRKRMPTNSDSLIDPELVENRNLTPITREFVEGLINICDLTLAQDEKDETFVTLEGVLAERASWLEDRLQKDARNQEDFEKLQQLEYHQFLLKYGDYKAATLNEIRKLGRKIKGDRFGNNFWSEILTEYDDE